MKNIDDIYIFKDELNNNTHVEIREKKIKKFKYKYRRDKANKKICIL